MRIPFRKSPNPSFGVDARDDGFDDNDAAAALRGSLIGRMLLRRMVARKEAAKRHILTTCAAALRSTASDIRAAAHRRGCEPTVEITSKDRKPFHLKSFDVIELKRRGRLIGRLDVGASPADATGPCIEIKADPEPDMAGRTRTARMVAHGLLTCTHDASGLNAPTVDDLDRWAASLDAIADLVGDAKAQALADDVKAAHETRSARIRVETGMSGVTHATISSATPDGRPASVEIADEENQCERILDVPVPEARAAMVVTMVSGNPPSIVLSLQRTLVEAITDPLEAMRVLSAREETDGIGVRP
jgi:hypothetical protein